MDNNNLINTRLGKYIIQAKIGRGGMGEVYRGFDPDLKRNVAVKVLPPNLVWRKEFVERFLREARAAARLQHPSIVTIHNVGQEGNWRYFVMEYVDGPALTGLIHDRGPLPAHETIGLLRPLAAALDFAHQQGLVHRDIKPANILVDSNGHVKLTDFGIARAAQESRLTATGSVMGTPAYMSPEQALGKTVDACSDQYSLAVVAYEMLCGCVPFQADSTLALLRKITHEAPPSIRQARPDLPADVDAVLDRALAKNPGQRYPTVTAFIDALERALVGSAMEQAVSRRAPRVSPAGGTPTPAGQVRVKSPPARGQRRLLIALGALAGLAALVLLVAVGFMLDSDAEATGSGSVTALSTRSGTRTPDGAGSNGASIGSVGGNKVAGSATPAIQAARSSATPRPTRTPTASATVTPSDTPAPSPTPCQVAVMSVFADTWNAYASQLGCPPQAGKSGVWMVQERFQRGIMLWREDNAKIYVLYDDGRWERYDDDWHEGDPEFTCGSPASPPTPVRGFGKVWCTEGDVQDGLGAATTAEWGDHGAVQRFRRGLALQAPDGLVYALFDNGSWK